MTQLFTKFSITFALFVFAFGAFGFITSTNVFINEAQAVVGGSGGCGSCGGGSTGGDGGGGGGDNTPQTPTCEISINKIEVTAIGEAYRVTWAGGPASASFYINGSAVADSGAANFTFTGPNYDRFRLVGNNGGVTCEKEVRIIKKVVEVPRCESFTATPSTLPAGGGSVTLRWDTTNATNATLDGQSVAGDGSLTVNVTANKTFTLNLSNSAGQASCSAPVTVTPPVMHPVCDSFTANPTSLPVGGGSVNLAWNTTNATTVTLDGQTVSADGSQSVNVTANKTFTLNLSNTAGTKSCTATVTVPPTPLHPICDSFTASPTMINRGQSSKLTWATTNADSVTINNAIGGVSVDGSIDVSPLQNITYVLTATKGDKTVTCDVPVKVNQPEANITCAANVNFSANNNSIRRGDSSTLTWSTNGLSSVRFDNLSSTGLSGSQTVNPSDSITYTLIGTKGSQTINCPVTINVSSDNNNGGGGGGSSAVKCSLKISDNKISRGDRVTLKWDTTRATEVTIKDNHGKTLIDTDGKSSSQKKDLYDGELTLRPEKDTTYTLVAEKGSKDKTCKVTVDVEDTVVVTQVRDQQPLVTGIALTNVPYTGFEAGPFMTSVFYTLLAAWALYMAYVLVGRRNGMNVSAFTPATVTSDIVPSTMLMPEKVTAAPAFYQVLSPVAATTATVGYEAHTEANEAIEAQAHAANVLLSTDAIAYFVGATANEDRTTVLAQILTAAKASYPSEEGWVVISADRMVELAAKF